MDTLLHDIRYASRMLLRSPTVSALALLALALGIGANATVFSVVNGLLLRPLAVGEPDRLVAIYTTDRKNPGFNPISHLNWKDYRREAPGLRGIMGYDWTAMSVSTGQEGHLVVGQLVSGDYFNVLGVEARLGRTFLPEEDGAPGVQPVVVLSHGFWVNHYGGDPAAVGRTLAINGQPYTIVGVMPPSFTGTDVGVRPEMWVPMAMNRLVRTDPLVNWYEQRRGLFVHTIGRLAPGTTLEQAQAGMTTVATRLEREYPNDNQGRRVRLVPLARATINPGARDGFVAATAVLMTIVGLVLLIACANVSNLLLARALGRRREIAIRLAIGASRRRLVRQLLTESLLLAVPGAVLGLLVALWARSVLLSFLPPLPFPVTPEIPLDLDGRVLAFTFAVAVGSGLLFGLVPALQASRPELVGALKDQGEARLPGLGRLGARNLLVVGQVALSLVALVGAGLFVRGLGAAAQTAPGFETRRLLKMAFDLGLQGYDQPRGEAFVRELLERVRALPGVKSATVAQAAPLQPTLARSVLPDGQALTEERVLVAVSVVGPEYFETVGVPILEGRGFREEDRSGPKVVVVNQTMARKFWPGRDPLGQTFRFFSDEVASQVVGVARDAKYQALGEDPQPYVYEPLSQRWGGALNLLVRTTVDPGPQVPVVERELHALDKDLPLVGIATVAQVLKDALWAPRMGASLLGVFGLLALFLASVGIYGVMSYSVRQREHEIGIRMALGARRADVLRLVLGQGMAVLGLGLVLGLILAFGLSHLVANLIFGVSPRDVGAFFGTSVLLVLVGFLANLVPARRATLTDATAALRYR